jgi:glycosyltransferase involved in cell wall biosynthesis
VTGFTVPAEDHNALCDRLTALLGDEGLRRQMGVNAAQNAQGYKWETITKQIIGVYEELIEKR